MQSKESEAAKKGNGSDGADFASRLPAVSLPKGGGAIRGMGEKFAANPVTGTASLSIPIVTSPGRSGFGPQLSLSYDSGAGNGPFGFGWSLSLPSITRKTDKGLPKYQDWEESDVFILSGAEDLVPVMERTDTGWRREAVRPRTVNGVDYEVERYRPRIEGLFARIERWKRVGGGEVHWRSISKDNITTLYGKTRKSRIFDPEDSGRVFSWLICESYDDKGNAIFYEYVPEDSAGLSGNPVHEANRTDKAREANRYLKRVKYGNKVSRLLQPDLSQMDWLFEVVLDYGEGHYIDVPSGGAGEHKYVRASSDGPDDWPARKDPFSGYRAGFEVRTCRLCRRVLMFHHFLDELGTDDYLVRSTEFDYREGPIASFVTSATQSGYTGKRQLDDSFIYLKKSLPPLEFDYSRPDISEQVVEVDAESLENLPIGLDGSAYQWLDLDGEGLSGILAEQAGGWYYKRNISPLPEEGGSNKNKTVARFAPLENVASKPSLAEPRGRHRFLDLAGDGRQDVVLLERPVAGLYERTHDEQWDPFRYFRSCPNVDWNDPNLRFVDLTGDGHADVLITEQEAFTWYPSLAEEGFGQAEKTRQALDEDAGARLVFADGTQSIYLADLSGDGLTDLARIRNCEVCYWPNLGYGRFGRKVTMDNSPLFDQPDQFNQQRIRLADIDGSGTTDIIYLNHDRVDIYRNESGNRWSDAEPLTGFPPIDNLASVMAVDLLGNGTACLVWSSPLPGNAGRQMRYIDLMGGQKPHLLERIVNNLGAETQITYAPSTEFYLKDKFEGTPWVTKIPFPVHVVEKVETFDQVSRNRFVTCYTYHHGYFDGVEREFRGFGMVEQLDTEEFATFKDAGELPDPTNGDAALYIPPVLTKTWFHTGSYIQRLGISRHFESEYFQGDPDAELLRDTIFPEELPFDEEREACRALKGSMLRQEVYACDGTDKEELPYTVTEQNFTIRCLQPHAGNRHAVFFTHPGEAINYHYERNPSDPRIAHTLTLEVDMFGNVLKEASIAYGRRQQDTELSQPDWDIQAKTQVTFTENDVTNAIEDKDVDYRTPLPCETRTFELTGYGPTELAVRFVHGDFVEPDPDNPGRLRLIFDDDTTYEDQPGTGQQRRLIENLRTYYRPDDFGQAPDDDPLALLELGVVEPLALQGESYKLAFTPALARKIYVDDGKVAPGDLDGILGGDGRYTHTENDANWWIPSGRAFLSPGDKSLPSEESDFARRNFFLPHRSRDPFHTREIPTEGSVTYDDHYLLVVETRDALGNVTTAETEDDDNDTKVRIDYRVLQPFWLTDPNGNRTRAAFDAMGMVAGTAVMGKPGDGDGDPMASFEADLTEAQIDAFYDASDPHGPAGPLLGDATTRIVYSLERFRRSREANPEDQSRWQPAFAATIARETHVGDLAGETSKTQISFSFSDGFGREIQKKIQAEPGPVEGLGDDIDPRWVGSGWTIFNNKGKPVRQYEPFFSRLAEKRHKFEFGAEYGVSPTLFYDPVGRVVATLRPDHTYEKVVFDPWRQQTWDVNDTVRLDPETDEHVGSYMATLIGNLRARPQGWKTWLRQRLADPDNPPPDTVSTDPKARAAVRALRHAGTPATAHFDSLGRTFLTQANNGKGGGGHDILFETRSLLDIEGNLQKVIDAKGRTVMACDYSIAGPEEDDEGNPANTNLIRQLSMEAGTRWMLNDVAGNPIRSWDSRDHETRTGYDALRRPLRIHVTGVDPARPLLTERLVYGEQHPEALVRNLRGTLCLHLDQAGVAVNARNDFKGNPANAARRVASDFKDVIEWSLADAAIPVPTEGPPPLPAAPFNEAALEAELAPLLAAETWTSVTTYDALNRPVTVKAPDETITRNTYNAAGLLETVVANLQGSRDNNEDLVWTPFVTNIDYDEKGQREKIEYATKDGRGVTTGYTYDDLTFRLTGLKTERQLDGKKLQDLGYTYDPAGNITHIKDDALQTIYFNGEVIKPDNDYHYDPTYRLVEAKGREHRSLTAQPWSSYNDKARTQLAHRHDWQAMREYTEKYSYDKVGNFDLVRHAANGGTWRRQYRYEAPSLVPEDAAAGLDSNRLTQSFVGTADPPNIRAVYTHDAHGNMTEMPQLQEMEWDHRDQLHMSRRRKAKFVDPDDVEIDLADTEGVKLEGEKTYYVYDASGERVRKVTLDTSGGLKDERIYLGGLEIYKQHTGPGPHLERQTLHIMDDRERIALVETRNDVDDGTPAQLIRYQFGNHLGSASLELNDQATVISYEEYTPWGSTSFQSQNAQIKAAHKRNRYTGKERDEESGLYYHGARYYAPWLGRWTAADPAGLSGGPHLYNYVLANPIKHADPDGLKPIIAVGRMPVVVKKERLWKEAEIDPREVDNFEPMLREFVKEGRVELGLEEPLDDGTPIVKVNNREELKAAIRRSGSGGEKIYVGHSTVTTHYEPDHSTNPPTLTEIGTTLDLNPEFNAQKELPSLEFGAIVREVNKGAEGKPILLMCAGGTAVIAENGERAMGPDVWMTLSVLVDLTESGRKVIEEGGLLTEKDVLITGFVWAPTKTVGTNETPDPASQISPGTDGSWRVPEVELPQRERLVP